MTSGDHTERKPVLHLPVRGTWKLIKSPGHARYAFDLAVVDRNSYRTLSRSRIHHILGLTNVEHSYSWAMPIYSPITGTVVHAENRIPDRLRLSLLRDIWTMVFSRPALKPDDISPYTGNQVIIDGAGLYVFMAHLKCGSLQVAEGVKVAAGQFIARVGNSGYTLEPHLHIQLFDQIDNLLTAVAPPFMISQYERWTGNEWELVRDAPLQKGDLIRGREK